MKGIKDMSTKKIGFVDLYISEWHANNYPGWMAKINEQLGYDFEIAYAWAEIDTSPNDGVTTAEWCEKFGAEKCDTIEELCEKSDMIVILAPSNPEKHLEYAETALHQTVYMFSEMLSQIKFLRGLIRSLSEGELPDESILPRTVPVFFSKDRFFYITALQARGFPKECLSEQSIYRSHLEARELMRGEAYSDACELLERVLADAPDAFTRYFAILDLEKCKSKIDDFKSAYEYAKRRMELHDKYTL